MDEPLSNLDAKLRVQMRAELKRFHQDLRATVIYVTHDQLEAVTMADRMAAADGGVQQYDRLERVFENPVNLFVAGFVGSPAMNFLKTRSRTADRRRARGCGRLAGRAFPSQCAPGAGRVVARVLMGARHSTPGCRRKPPPPPFRVRSTPSS